MDSRPPYSSSKNLSKGALLEDQPFPSRDFQGWKKMSLTMTNIQDNLRKAHRAVCLGEYPIAQTYCLTAMQQLVSSIPPLDSADLPLITSLLPEELGDLGSALLLASTVLNQDCPSLCLHITTTVYNKLDTLSRKIEAVDALKTNLMISAGVCPECHQKGHVLYEKACSRCLERFAD